MPLILTIDDSNTIRTIITKQLTELGFDVEQAEDGAQGLAKLEEIAPDLILLDVTMPVMDGPTMLARLRESGNKTPVIMLTSESKRAIVANAVKLGIEDYILKPFKPEELRAKVQKVLRVDAVAKDGGSPASPGAAEVAAPTPASASASSAGARGNAGRPFVDILVVDDMENVHKKLRSLLPQHVTLNGCTSARDALQHCQERVYRGVLVDLVIPDVNSVALMNQLRALQPHAVMIALALRTANEIGPEIKGQGFQDFLFKPFDAGAIEDFLSRHFEVEDLLSVDGNVLGCAKFDGKEERVERYYTRLKTLAKETLEKLASACYEEAILDLGHVPVRNDKLLRFVIEVEKDAHKLGIALRLVGNADVKKVMSSVTDTASLPLFPTLEAAREAA